MKDSKQILAGVLLIVMSFCILGGCTQKETEKNQVTLTVKLPPFTVANADTDITDAYDMLIQAGKDFSAQYKDAEVTVDVVKFGYTEEDEYITGCFDTEDAADILFEGYFNMAGYVHTGRVVPLDDIITEEMESDIDSTILEMSRVNGKTYMLPFYSLQNTLCFNKNLFRECGLDEYIGEEGEIQSWTPGEWEIILSELAEKLPDMSYPMMMYAKNDQGDTHIMTLLRSRGSSFFDEDGHFNISTEEGIAALQWIADSYTKGYFPAGCENLEINDCNTLFLNNQLAIHLTNSATSMNMDLNTTGFVNFPSEEGNGYNTSFVTGFEVFDNGNEATLKAAKDFVSYFYHDEELMNYAQIGLPASSAVAEREGEHIFMQESYSANTVNTVDFTANNPNWRGVRDGEEEKAFGQEGLSLLTFDEKGNYYNASGNQVRWSGSLAVISEEAPEQQVEITTLPTTTEAIDEMVFILQMEQPVLTDENTLLTHVAVVRDMNVFDEKFQVPSFEGKGESYIISSEGTKIYRGQMKSEVIGDAYNVLKPLEKVDFQYDSSFEELSEAVAKGHSCSLEFADADGTHYYVTSSPMDSNGWALLNIVPSETVSARMQSFMNRTLIGMGAITFIVVLTIFAGVLLVVRYQASQNLMRQQAEINLALKEAARAAQEASQAKTVFLSHMSHDIRTPINGIMGMTDIAVRNLEDHTRLADCLDKIASASRHFLSLVNDVLDMSRIESGKVQIEESPFFVDTLLDGCYSVIAGQALEKNITLYKDFSGVEQPALKGDELHLRQILINILGNAVKFTPQGGNVYFTAEVRAISEKEAELRVEVSDNGIGMSREFQKKIFEPFSQAEEGSRSRYQGTGLGMSIVRQLVDLMGGSIELESEEGKGSTFIISLCLPIEENMTHKKEDMDGEEDLDGMRVLLVEDNELNMEIAQYVLEDCKARVTQAFNGQEALDLFVNSPESSFEVILMDIMMPVMDGLTATRAIRASGKGDARTIPIVAMTANAYSEDRRTALEAGMDRHLAKPLERGDLIQTLQELRKNIR